MKKQNRSWLKPETPTTLGDAARKGLEATLNVVNSKGELPPDRDCPWLHFNNKAGSLGYALEVYEWMENEFGLGLFCICDEEGWWYVEERARRDGLISSVTTKPTATMKKQNQSKEVAERIVNLVWEACRKSFKNGEDTPLGYLDSQVREIIDAATAEVKKEELAGDGELIGSIPPESFVDETHATLDVQREQTGRAPLPKHVQETLLSGGIPEVCVFCDGKQGWDRGIYWDTCPNCKGTGYEPEKRVTSQSTLSQAPTDSSKEKENATCLAAPSRKQETKWCLCNYTGSPGTAPECPVHPSADAAARVEPTKEEKEDL